MNVDFAEQRTKMVDGQVRTTDVTSLPLISAMLTVPREAFVGATRRDLAYIDEDLQIAPASEHGPARFLMEASPFAKLVQLAEIQPTDAVLDVGCGSGYSSAVLSRLAGSVVALESDSQLAALAASTLASLGYASVTVVEGALEAGHPSKAPYDLIFVGGAVEVVPEALLAQLGEGGRLVVVEGQGNAARARLFLKSNGSVAGRHAFNAAVKPLPGFKRVKVFEF